MTPASATGALRRRVHYVLEAGIGHDFVATAVNLFLIILILGNVVAYAVETVPSVVARYGIWLHVFEWFSVAVFGLEYALRIWSSVELPFLSHLAPWRARLTYAARPLQVVDLLAFLPSIVMLALLSTDLAVVRVLGLFRFLKLARYSTAMHTLGRVVREERSAIYGTLVVMLALILFARATGMYHIEREAQPDRFGTIPDAMWWAVVTLGTIGYGDAVPVTAAGKLFAGVMIIVGLGVFALPIGIIVTGFGREMQRREFVVTWSLVARVPLFAGLDAEAVARVMTLLHSETYEEGDVVVRRGDDATSMFFIASGDVLVETEDGEVRLGEGDFFGEMALLDHRAHTHSVFAASRCRCLILERNDFERLCRRHPAILARVREVSGRRRTSKS